MNKSYEKLINFGYFVTDKISTENLTTSNYITTDNMLQNISGIKDASIVPNHSNASSFKEGDILISRIRPYLKKIWLSDRKGGASNDVYVFRPNNPNLSRLIYYSLCQDAFFEFSLAGSSGSKMPRAEEKHISGFPIYLNGEKSLYKESEFLNLIDEILIKNNIIIKEIRNQLSMVYSYWFTQFDFPDENGKPYQTFGGKMVYNEKLKKEIPEGWEVQTLLNNTISKIVAGGVEPYDGTKEYLPTAVIDENGPLEGELLRYDEKPNRANMSPVKNSVWVAKMADSPKRLFFTDKSILIDKYIISTGMFAFTSDKEHYEYLMMYLFSDHFENLKDRFAQGATQRAINQGNLALFPIIIPDEKALTKFHNLTKDMVRKIELLNEENQELKKQREFLLPLLMNGQVTLK